MSRCLVDRVDTSGGGRVLGLGRHGRAEAWPDELEDPSERPPCTVGVPGARGHARHTEGGELVREARRGQGGARGRAWSAHPLV